MDAVTVIVVAVAVGAVAARLHLGGRASAWVSDAVGPRLGRLSLGELHLPGWLVHPHRPTRRAHEVFVEVEPPFQPIVPRGPLHRLLAGVKLLLLVAILCGLAGGVIIAIAVEATRLFHGLSGTG